MIVYVTAILCVFGLAAGQILFKISASAFSQTESIFALKPVTMFLTAVGLYGITSLVWVWILQKIELGQVYPLMALAFVIVPIGSYIFFGERFSVQYFIGIVFIMVGIVISVKA